MGVECFVVLYCATVVAGLRIGDVVRRELGDTFQIHEEPCGTSQCAEHGAASGSSLGTAAGATGNAAIDGCSCVCPQRAPLFREDRELCVDDLPECSLATFGSFDGVVQRIPFVYLPLKGQIIHPSREITFQGVKTPICAVSGAQFLSRKGFMDLRNSLDADVPFSLFRDEGRTFLQWSGEDDVRQRMSGRMMVVRLLCRDVVAATSSPLDLSGVFTPCVAFRVQGVTARQLRDVTEVHFASNAHTSGATSNSGLSVSEYIAIGISSLLLGLIYVASVFLYLHIKKRRKIAAENNNRGKPLKSIKRLDGVTITERDIIRINNERIQTLSNSITNDENGVVKQNPLLAMSRQYPDIKNGYITDSGSNLSDSEEYTDRGNNRNRYNEEITSVTVHSNHRDIILQNERYSECSGYREESSIERLPHEHVSIVETTDDREISRPVGTTRRKLYFNPAYFEPQLMVDPPQAALEFLIKIREVISIAKHKMASKRFQPVLNEIPEEHYPSTGNSLDIYLGLESQRSGSAVSLKRENSRKRPESCVGCPGCKLENKDVQNTMNYDSLTCSNCIKNTRGDKQHSIRKWLENIPTVKQTSLHNDSISQIKHRNALGDPLLAVSYTYNNKGIRKQNSFNIKKYSPPEIFEPRKGKSSTLSVRSAPHIRNLNLPLPEFENTEYHHNNFIFHGPTVSSISDIKPVGLTNFSPGIYQRNPLENQRKHPFIINKSTLPDMVNEAIALEHCDRRYSQSITDDDKLCNNLSKDTANKVYTENYFHRSNDYETDSLERTINKKDFTTTNMSEYVEVTSSQASPSLSNALPLEEEVTMQNDVYKRSSSNSNTPSPNRDLCKTQNHYETIGEIKTINQNENKKYSKSSGKGGSNYSLVSEVYVNNSYNFGSSPTSPSGSECSMGSRKLLNNKESKDKPGCLTIEVKDPPENYIKIQESDGFEPDTLDRKHQKSKEPNIKNDILRLNTKDSLQVSRDKCNIPYQSIQLRSSGIFKKSIMPFMKNIDAKFSSLRVQAEGKNSNVFNRPKLLVEVFNKCKSVDENLEPSDKTFDWETEEGRTLTLELRHSKRQRPCTTPPTTKFKNLPRPDILPPLPPNDDNPIYEQPLSPPKRVEINYASIATDTKNVNGGSLSPRNFKKSSKMENINNKAINQSDPLSFGSPKGASVHVQDSDYEILDPSCENRVINNVISETCRPSAKRKTQKYPSQAMINSQSVNTNTYVKVRKDERNAKLRFRRKKGSNIEDSGYLSSDSTSSRQTQRKIVIGKIVSCSESSDDSENEARSESGAESVETHSVFFGSFRKPNAPNINYVLDKPDKKGIFKSSSSKKN